MRIGDVYRLSVNPRKAADESPTAAPGGLELSLSIVAYRLVTLVADGVDALIGVVVRRRGRGDGTSTLEA